jgi:hypothetical protein
VSFWHLLALEPEMGVDIVYFTKSHVSPEQVRAIVAASREPDHQPWLLCEPIHFLDMPGYENQLFGTSKLNLMPDPTEKAEAESYNAEKNDLEFLLDKLCEISKRFRVDWTIQIEDAELGSINNGVCDPAVREGIEAMASVSDELGEFDGFV